MTPEERIDVLSRSNQVLRNENARLQERVRSLDGLLEVQKDVEQTYIDEVSRLEKSEQSLKWDMLTWQKRFDRLLKTFNRMSKR
jgi:FtsZ-binding cell division protein ZapB